LVFLKREKLCKKPCKDEIQGYKTQQIHDEACYNNSDQAHGRVEQFYKEGLKNGGDTIEKKKLGDLGNIELGFVEHQKKKNT
jgi:hypothetical protein